MSGARVEGWTCTPCPAMSPTMMRLVNAGSPGNAVRQADNGRKHRAPSHIVPGKSSSYGSQCMMTRLAPYRIATGAADHSFQSRTRGGCVGGSVAVRISGNTCSPKVCSPPGTLGKSA